MESANTLSDGDILASSSGSMMAEEISIPKRAVFKPAEVCSIAGVQPYILRSWEAEFPTLALAKRKGGASVYRRVDVEMVLQIKALVYSEGLTLGAAHRKLDAAKQPPPHVEDEGEEDTLPVGLFNSDARDRIVGVKQGLGEILELLSPKGQTVQTPLSNEPKEGVKRTTNVTRMEGDKATEKKARTEKISRAVKATKAKPKKVVRRKRTA